MYNSPMYLASKRALRIKLTIQHSVSLGSIFNLSASIVLQLYALMDATECLEYYQKGIFNKFIQPNDDEEIVDDNSLARTISNGHLRNQSSHTNVRGIR